MWLKSTTVLPRIIDLQSVVSINGSINFNPVEWSKYKYKKNTRTKSNLNKKYYTTRDDGDGTYLYVLNDDFLKAISLTAIFDNPYEAVSYAKCGELNVNAICNPWMTDIKTDRDIFDSIVKASWQTLLQVRNNADADIHNDSQSNFKQVIQPKI